MLDSCSANGLFREKYLFADIFWSFVILYFCIWWLYLLQRRLWSQRSPQWMNKDMEDAGVFFVTGCVVFYVFSLQENTRRMWNWLAANMVIPDAGLLKHTILWMKNQNLENAEHLDLTLVPKSNQHIIRLWMIRLSCFSEIQTHTLTHVLLTNWQTREKQCLNVDDGMMRPSLLNTLYWLLTPINSVS